MNNGIDIKRRGTIVVFLWYIRATTLFPSSSPWISEVRFGRWMGRNRRCILGFGLPRGNGTGDRNGLLRRRGGGKELQLKRRKRIFIRLWTVNSVKVEIVSKSTTFWKEIMAGSTLGATSMTCRSVISAPRNTITSKRSFEEGIFLVSSVTRSSVPKHVTPQTVIVESAGDIDLRTPWKE